MGWEGEREGREGDRWMGGNPHLVLFPITVLNTRLLVFDHQVEAAPEEAKEEAKSE